MENGEGIELAFETIGQFLLFRSVLVSSANMLKTVPREWERHAVDPELKAGLWGQSSDKAEY